MVKKVAKKVTRKSPRKAVAKKEVEVPQVLEPGEMLSIQSELEEVKQLNHTLEMIKKDIENLDLKLKVSMYEHNALVQSKEKIGQGLRRASEMLELKRASYKSQIDKLAEKYRVTNSNWGFDPDTGAIV